MKWISAIPRQSRSVKAGAGALMLMVASLLSAQVPAPRIQSEIIPSQRVTLQNSLHRAAQPQNDIGRMAGGARLNGISIYFNRTAAQQAALDALVAAQQDPSSSLYHQWLTPDQFAARFGMAQADLDQVTSWLQQQGFTVESTSRSHNMIRFSGTVNQVESAFGTEMHYYQTSGVKHFAPSTALSVPAAIAPVISGVRNLDDFRPAPRHIPARGAFTSSVSGSVFFAPGDIVTAYDVTPLYSGGINGAGQSIAVAGQSAVNVGDIENFQNAAGLTKKDPMMVLVPGTGDSTVIATGDEGESDLDLEWSAAMAPGANIVFVYTGSNTNYSVFDSAVYAIDEKLAPIISISYSSCELELTQSDATTLESIFQQAASQGQTVVAASGDQGSTACSGDTHLTTAQQETVAVNYPASSAYVTGIGGTEITSANSVSTNSTYWTAAGGSDVIASAKTYIPEVAWNDDTSGQALSASGGGTSTLIARPSWQTGVTGIASGKFRLVPDISLYSSPAYPGFLYCTSDTSNWNSSQTASCGNGFRASTSDSTLTVAGGTSFATPIFAGMIALINQKQGYTTGQGNINPVLYKLAANSSTYASAFHDVTSGNNNCLAGTSYCSATTGFSAGTGYDEVTGLGSVDVTNLASAWPANTGTGAGLAGTTTTVSASSTTPTSGQSVTFTITVAPSTGSGTPSGTVNLSIDGGGSSYSSNGTTAQVTLGANGTATYTTSFTTSGTHEVIAQYAGNTAFTTSTGSSEIVIAVPSSGKGTIKLGASGVTVARGSTGTSTITITPAGGYTGTVLLSFTSSNTSALANLCYAFSNTTSSGSGSVTVPGTAAVTTQLLLDTNAADCGTTTGGLSKGGLRQLRFTSVGKVAARGPASAPTSNRLPAGIAFAGLLLAGCLGRYARKFRGIAAVVALASVGMMLSACGGSSSSSSTTSNPPKGNYTITVTGQDSVTAAITGSTTFTLTIN